MGEVGAVIFSALSLLVAHIVWRRTSLPAEPLQIPDRIADLAERLGLADQAQHAIDRLDFQRDGFQVTITTDTDTRFHLRIDTADRLPAWLHIVPKRGQPAPEGAHPTADNFVDRAFWAVGAPRALGAILRHSIRSQLLALRNVTIRPGSIESSCTASRTLHVQRWLDSVLLVAHALTECPEDYDAALLDAFADEPAPSMRLHLLTLLCETDVEEEHRQAALRKALDDPDPRVRCFAALRVPVDEAVAELRGLAGGYEVPEDVRLTAFQGLLKVKKGDELVPLLVAAASGPEGRLSRRALTWAVSYGGNEALRAVVARPRISISTLSVAIDMARRRNASCVVPELLQMIDWTSAAEERRVLAIEGLGALGSVDVIASLKRVAEKDREAHVAAAARNAVQQIQSRCQADVAGALSLAEGDRGQLAVVDSGAVSIAADEGTETGPDDPTELSMDRSTVLSPGTAHSRTTRLSSRKTTGLLR